MGTDCSAYVLNGGLLVEHKLSRASHFGTDWGVPIFKSGIGVVDVYGFIYGLMGEDMLEADVSASFWRGQLLGISRAYNSSARIMILHESDEIFDSPGNVTDERKLTDAIMKRMATTASSRPDHEEDTSSVIHSGRKRYKGAERPAG